jgi:hypothetical protein
VSAAGRVSVLDILHALRLIRIREPVLAHEKVVAEAYSASSHEYFRDGEGRHDGGGCDGVERGLRSLWMFKLSFGSNCAGMYGCQESWSIGLEFECKQVT